MLLTGCSIDISNSSFCNGPQLDVPCGERSSPDSGDCARLGGAAFRRSRKRPDLPEVEQLGVESLQKGEDAEQHGRSLWGIPFARLAVIRRCLLTYPAARLGKPGHIRTFSAADLAGRVGPGARPTL